MISPASPIKTSTATIPKVLVYQVMQGLYRPSYIPYSYMDPMGLLEVLCGPSSY